MYQEKVAYAIELFLSLTASWSTRWFNKPKFHIIMHLVSHIRRFGPPLLFATETFESYNTLICDFSVHSNRQAPSRDIGKVFANMSRIRHLLSGGLFCASLGDKEVSDKTPKAVDFRSVGSEVIELVEKDSCVKYFCGIPKWKEDIDGELTHYETY